MRIGLFTDSHYCNKEMLGEGRRPALGYERIENELPKFKENGVELVICLGDLVDDCHDEIKNIEMIRKISFMIRSFGMDFYCLMGNHDYQNFTREEFNFLTDGFIAASSIPKITPKHKSAVPPSEMNGATTPVNGSTSIEPRKLRRT